MKFSQQKILSLHEVKVTALKDSPGNFLLSFLKKKCFSFSEENTFAWLISSPKKSFIVRANSDRERHDWIAHLERCIRTASQKTQNQINAVAAHWIPDDKADNCMHCHVAKFSAVNRRHVRFFIIIFDRSFSFFSIVEIAV